MGEWGGGRSERKWALDRQGLGHCKDFGFYFTPKRPEPERVRGGEFSSIEHNLHRGSWNPLPKSLTLIWVFLSLPSAQGPAHAWLWAQVGEILLLGPMGWYGVGRKESGSISYHEGEAERGAGRALGVCWVQDGRAG